MSSLMTNKNVKIFCIGRGTANECYALKYTSSNALVLYAPKFRTASAAKRGQSKTDLQSKEEQCNEKNRKNRIKG